MNPGSTSDAVRRRIAGAVRGLVAGSDEPFELHDDDNDVGMVAPDSVVRRVHTDAAMFIGGIRAILLQSLHPDAMYAVAQHSAYETDPLGRLQRTAAFLAATTFGSGTEARQAVEVVRAIHRRVEGTLPDGRPYRASDPHLLRWVHATEVDSFMVAYRRFGSAALTPVDADQYVADMAAVSLALGATEAPGSVRELDATIGAYRPELARSDESLDATRFLVAAPLPVVAKPAYALMFAAAVGTLPWWARNLLLLPTVPGVNPLAIRPAAAAMTRTLQWALRVDAPEGPR